MHKVAELTKAFCEPLKLELAIFDGFLNIKESFSRMSATFFDAPQRFF
jgi:hypothetical protein